MAAGRPRVRGLRAQGRVRRTVQVHPHSLRLSGQDPGQVRARGSRELAPAVVQGSLREGQRDPAPNLWSEHPPMGAGV